MKCVPLLCGRKMKKKDIVSWLSIVDAKVNVIIIIIVIVNNSVRGSTYWTTPASVNINISWGPILAKAAWFKSCKYMVSLTVQIMLLMQGVESNPGPLVPNSKTNLSIRTYNTNGLGNLDKLRRLLIKARTEVRKGGILLLQETHVKDENIIKMYWNMNYVSSCVSTQSAGVIILYDN